MKVQRPHILYLGDSTPGTTSFQRCMALRELGHDTTLVDDFPMRLGFFHRLDNLLYRKGLPWMGHRSPVINRNIRLASRGHSFGILWIDKGLYVTSETIEEVKAANPDLKVLGYSPDYMASRTNNSRWFIAHSRLYDLFVTTKSYAVEWHKSVGCKKVLFIGKSYDPATHRYLCLDAELRRAIGGPVGFIGTYETERAAALAYLAANGVSVKVYGSGWGRQTEAPGMRIVRRPLYGDEYARAINAFDINLCFLRAANLDVQTSRSIEIPACGAFMLAERTAEHLSLFKEGEEAEFFDGKKELLEKCRFYLAHPARRRKIAAAGRRRCIRSGYSNRARLAKVIKALSGSERLRRESPQI